jgi:2'-5' RNA ligase
MSDFYKIWKSRNIIVTNKPNWKKFLKDRVHFCFIIRVPLSIKEYSQLEKQLKKVPEVRVIPRDRLHITLKQAEFQLTTGYPIKNGKKYFSNQEIIKISLEAKKLIDKHSSFTITLSNVSIFSDVLFFEVKKNQALFNIHKDLCTIRNIPFENERDGKNYLPHVAFAELASGIEKDIIPVVESMRKQRSRKIRISQVDLVVLKQKKGLHYPSFEKICTYRLKK